MSQDTEPIGLVPEDLVRTMTGLEWMLGWIRGELPSPPMAGVLDFRMVEAEHGRVVFAATPDARFYNPIGTVHGGYAATLLDSCMGCAVHSTLAAGQSHTTLELKVNYVRAMTAATGKVTAEGRVLHAGRQVATAEGYLRDAGGRLLAHGTTSCLIFTRQRPG